MIKTVLIKRAPALEGGVEITVGLGKVILDVLKKIAQGTGEASGVAAPYVLRRQGSC